MCHVVCRCSRGEVHDPCGEFAIAPVATTPGPSTSLPPDLSRLPTIISAEASEQFRVIGSSVRLLHTANQEASSRTVFNNGGELDTVNGAAGTMTVPETPQKLPR